MKITQFFSYIVLVSGVLLLGLVLNSCRKYEDGPVFSIRSKTSRVVNNWQPFIISRNRTDVITEVDTFLLNFTKGGDFSWDIKMSKDTASTSIQGTWEFAKVKEAIRMEYEDFDSVLTVPGVRLLFMDIKRLKEDELWVEYLWEGDEYAVQLIPN